MAACWRTGFMQDFRFLIHIIEDFVSLTAQMKFSISHGWKLISLCCQRLINKTFKNLIYDNGFYFQTPVTGSPNCPPYLASPVVVSTWLTQALYISTGLVFMFKFLSSMMSLTTGASSCLSAFWPRAPLLKLTTILMTVGFPVTMSWIWSTLELTHMDTTGHWIYGENSELG